MTFREEIEEAAIRTACPYCHVTPGHWCRTRRNNTAHELHGLRTRPLMRMWWLAYYEGEREGTEVALNHVERVLEEFTRLPHGAVIDVAEEVVSPLRAVIEAERKRVR